MLGGLANCTTLVHVDLSESLHDVAGLELAVLPHLESLHIALRDSSMSSSLSAVPPFAADEHVCRFGLRALPHLHHLALMSVQDVYDETAVSALTISLRLLPRLASFEMRGSRQGVVARAVASCWAATTAMRGLKCSQLCEEILVELDEAAIALWPSGLTALMLSLRDIHDEFGIVNVGQVVGELDVAPLSWLSGHIAPLTVLRKLSILTLDLEGAQFVAVRPMLEALSATTSLRQLSLVCADVRGVEWGAAPLRALTSLELCWCAADNAMTGLALLTGLRSLALRWCQLQPDLLLACMNHRRVGLALRCAGHHRM